MKKLSIEQAEPIRKKFAPDWEIRKGKYLYKKVAFDDYNQALRFFMVIEKPQIKLDHFADIGFFYNEVILMVYTHDVGGLTQLDFELALYIDEALKQMDARQLDEEKKGLYYYVNKRKKAGTSRKKGHPKAPSDQDWKDAAKTAKKENVEENLKEEKYSTAFLKKLIAKAEALADKDFSQYTPQDHAFMDKFFDYHLPNMINQFGELAGLATPLLQSQYYEGWSAAYKKSINCDNPKGFSQKAHCAGRKK